MRRNTGVLVVALCLAAVPVLAAGEEVTLKGEVVEVSCYSKLGVAKGTGAAHVACAIDCAKQGKPLGLLTDGDGLFRFVGDYADNNGAKLMPFIGKQVEVKGSREVYTDYRPAVRPTKITVTAIARNSGSRLSPGMRRIAFGSASSGVVPIVSRPASSK